MESSAARSVRLANEREVAKRKRERPPRSKQAAGDGAQTQTFTMQHSSAERAMATSNARLGLRPTAAADADDDTRRRATLGVCRDVETTCHIRLWSLNHQEVTIFALWAALKAERRYCNNLLGTLS